MRKNCKKIRLSGICVILTAGINRYLQMLFLKFKSDFHALVLSCKCADGLQGRVA